MTFERLWRGAVIGIVVGIVAMLVLLLSRAHDHERKLNDQRALLCKRQLEGLRSIATSQKPPELHAQMQFRYLDQGLSQFCLGDEMPVDSDRARTCYVMTDRGDACYADLVPELLSLYRKRWGSTRP